MMKGEGTFKLLSLGLFSLLFVTAITKANKNLLNQKNPGSSSVILNPDSINVPSAGGSHVLNHLQLAAQVNQFNQNRRVNPPELNVDSKPQEELLQK